MISRTCSEPSVLLSHHLARNGTMLNEVGTQPSKHKHLKQALVFQETREKNFAYIFLSRTDQQGRLGGSAVKWPTLAQVMILQFVSSSPTSGSVLTAQSLEPASDSVSPSLSAPPLLALSLSKINKHIKKKFFF